MACFAKRVAGGITANARQQQSRGAYRSKGPAFLEMTRFSCSRGNCAKVSRCPRCVKSRKSVCTTTKSPSELETRGRKGLQCELLTETGHSRGEGPMAGKYSVIVQLVPTVDSWDMRHQPYHHRVNNRAVNAFIPLLASRDPELCCLSPPPAHHSCPPLVLAPVHRCT